MLEKLLLDLQENKYQQNIIQMEISKLKRIIENENDDLVELKELELKLLDQINKIDTQLNIP